MKQKGGLLGMPLWLAIVVIVLVLGGVGVGIAAAAGAFEPKSGSYQVPANAPAAGEEPSPQGPYQVPANKKCSADDQAKFVTATNKMLTGLETLLEQVPTDASGNIDGNALVKVPELATRLASASLLLMTTYDAETPEGIRNETCDLDSKTTNDLNVKIGELKLKYPAFTASLPTL